MAGKRDPKKRSPAQAEESVDLVCNEESPESRLRDLQTPALSLLDAGPSHDDGADPLVGTVLAAKYEIHALCGRGGMGSVYKAKHFDLKRYVAVKVLHKHLLSHQGISDRFRLSAQAAHALRHPNLVSVNDFGYTEEGQFYLAMDYIQGETLTAKLRREQELSVDSFFKVFSQVLSGLKFCHQKGIVHRDIKPSNILITDREIKPDSIKLVDFGIAKVLPESESSIDHLTQTGELLGSPLYMSPEQCRGNEIDARTDLYALGCVMFEALSGKPPFQGKSAIETLMMHCSEPPPTLYEATGDAQLTEQLDAFIKRALAKDREERFGSAEEMEAALASIQRFLHLPKIARQRLNPSSSQTGTGSQSVQSSPAASTRKFGIGLVLVVFCIAAIGFLFAGRDVLKNSIAGTAQHQSVSKEHVLDTIKLGVIERKEGSLNQSDTRLKKGLAEAARVFGNQTREYMTALIELAATHIAIAESWDRAQPESSYYRSAQEYLQEAIKGCQLLSNKSRMQTGAADLSQLKLIEANATFQLAHIYTRQGNFAAAEPLFDRGFTLIDAKQPVNEDYQEFFSKYADYLWRAGREREAAKLQLTFHLEPWEVKLASEAPVKTTNLNGFWSENHFSVQLSDKDGAVTGSHCLVTKQGSRIDGGINEAKPTIAGVMNNGIFKGTVLSSYGQKAKLAMVRIDNFLVWKLLGVETDGESYLPEATFLRVAVESKE